LNISVVRYCAGTVQDIAKSKLSKLWLASVITGHDDNDDDDNDDDDEDDDDGDCHGASHVMLACADGNKKSTQANLVRLLKNL